jgi:hypothetical protein
MQAYGCICCRKLGFISPAEIHHITDGYRLGHDATLPLCPWHHRGVPPCGFVSKKLVATLYGPSLAESKRDFVAEYGSEMELLEEINSWLKGESPQEPRAWQRSESSLPF